MEPLTTFVSIVGLLGVWKSEANARESKNTQQFIDWLRRQNHDQLVNMLLDNAALMQALRGLVENQHDEVIAKLASLDSVLSSVASQMADFGSLAIAAHPEARLSDQAVSILRQMNHAGASRFIEIGFRGEALYQFYDADGALKLNDRRFIEDDILTLVELGLLRLHHGSKGSRIFTLTRAGSEVGELAGQPTGQP